MSWLSDFSLLAWARPQLQVVDEEFVKFFRSGWDPDVPLPPGEVAEVDTWPLTTTEEMLHPLLLYLLLVGFGMVAMRKGKALVSHSLLYRLKFVYNFTQIVLCSYMSMEALFISRREGWSLMPYKESLCAQSNAHKAPLSKVLWLFYMSKMLDFCDTFFIVAGGKAQQFSFLHCYHHISIYLIYFMLIRSFYDGEVYLTIAINGGVHAIMYTYYLISMHTSPHKITISWKQNLTNLQLAQFTYCVTHGLVGYFACYKHINRYCTRVYILYNGQMFYLFLKFYVAAYMKRSEASALARKSQKEDESKDVRLRQAKPKKH